MTFWFRVVAGFAGVAASTMSLSSCMSSPTYGTNKTAAEHLMDDVSNITTIVPDNNNDQIAYQPHPKLVVPAKTGQLAPPQQSVASSNPNWVESPEQTRQRLRDEATAGGNDYRSPLLKQNQTNQQLSTMQQRDAYREARKVQQGLYSDRRFLSDPPTDYRKVDTAEMNDLGTPEKEKEKERKKQAEAAKQSSNKWWDIFD